MKNKGKNNTHLIDYENISNIISKDIYNIFYNAFNEYNRIFKNINRYKYI